MQPLPQAPPPDWRQYVLRTIIWIAFVGTLGYAASTGNLGFLQNDVDLTIEPNRGTVTLKGGVPPVIEVKVTLRNNTSDVRTFGAPSACRIFRWVILDRAGAQAQARTDEAHCPDQEVKVQLKPGQSIEEFYAIPLLVERFNAGRDYTVRLSYWGVEGEFSFTAE